MMHGSRLHWIIITDLVILLAILILSFYLCFAAGERGFYAFDQSIVFDGSYRILSGQVPYRDFVLPFGPVVFWIQAVFFRLFGVSYFSYLIGAAVINVVATLCAILLIRLLFPRSRWLSYVAGVLTAIWFYPPFGTPWVDQTAYFFSLLALMVLTKAIIIEREHPRRGTAFYALCGMLAFLAFISKQNVGVFILPLYLLLPAAVYLPDVKAFLRRLGVFAAGICVSMAAFLAWLYSSSDVDTFRRYFIEVPSALGRERLSAFIENGLGLVRPYFGGRGPISVNIVTLLSLAIGVFAAVRARRAWRADGSRRRMMLCVISVWCVVFQHLFLNTTLNQPENGFGFIGIICAAGFGLALEMTGLGELRKPRSGKIDAPRSRRIRLAAMAAVIVLTAYASFSGIRASMTRKVQDIFQDARFKHPMPVEKLKPLRWGLPTRMGAFEISEEEVVNLYRFLRSRNERFFIFPDFTLFYGLLDVPSPQPVLWFHEGVTYSGSGNNALDSRVTQELAGNDVRIFIIERVSWFNTGRRLDDFPQLKSYLRAEFGKIGEIGTFIVYEKRR
jgi:hypothetical protein